MKMFTVAVRSALLLLVLNIGVSLALDICEYQLDGTRLAHPAHCNKFVECYNGVTARIMSCPLGLHFNRFEGMCDLKERAVCDKAFVNASRVGINCSECCAFCNCFTNPTCPPNPGTTPTPCTTPTPATPCEPNTPTMPITPATPSTPENPDTPVTPDNPNTPATPSSPGTQGTPATPSTPENPDTPVNPDNPNSPTTPSSPGTQGTPATPSTPENPASPGTPSSPETPSTPDYTPPSPATPVSPATPSTPSTGGNCSNNLTICADKQTGSFEYFNGTCHQYIVCVAGCATIMSCPANLEFSLALKRCEFSEVAHCPWHSPPAPVGPSGVTCAQRGKCANQKDGTMFASKSNSNVNGYIVCQCECEIERPCPAGTRFSEEMFTCVLSQDYEVANGDNQADQPALLSF